MRKSILPDNDSLADLLPSPVRAYCDAIAVPDFSVHKLLSEDGYLMGVPSVRFTGCRLVRFLAIAMAEKGGVPLRMATVSSYLIRERKPPSQTWRTFLENHANDIIATDTTGPYWSRRFSHRPD